MVGQVDADAPLDERVRQRLRQLRGERGLTLQQVADAASMDVSTLSRLESGRRRLAIDHLPGLAAALGVSADELLAPVTAPDPRVRRAVLVMDGMRMWPLTHRGAAGGLQAYRVEITDSGREPPATPQVHEGHDWLYVLHGRLRLLLGADELLVEPGEAVEFSTLVPHWMGALDEPVELIAIFGPHGERMHVRT